MKSRRSAIARMRCSSVMTAHARRRLFASSSAPHAGRRPRGVRTRCGRPSRTRRCPSMGLPRNEVMQRLIAMKQDDQDWRGGRVFSLVYSAGDDVHELLSDALALYSAENGLNVLAFPSIGTMQHDIVCNTATLLGADDPASGGAVEGYLTSGGTESLLQAVKTARDVGRERGIARPAVVAAESAHAAFTKAADYFDVDLVRVPVESRLPGQRRRTGGRLLRRHDHGGGLGADLSARGDRPHRRHRVDGPGPGHPVPRRRLHGRVPPPVPRRAGPVGRAVRLPPPGRDLHVGRRAQVRLRRPRGSR